MKSLSRVQLFATPWSELPLPSPQCKRLWFNSWVRKIPWRRARLSTPVFLCFPCGSAGKESACNEGDLGLIPGLGRCPGEGKGYPLQYSGLEISMDCSPPGSSVHGDSLGKNTGVDWHSLLQGIFLTQGSNPGLPHCRWSLYRLSHQGSHHLLT